MTKAELLEKLQAGEKDPENAPFAELVSECIVSGGLVVTDITQAFGISKPSVSRWCSGVSRPAPPMPKHVYSILYKLVQEKSQ